MNELYLIRHGVAEERGEAWPDDSKRPLTEDGAAKLRKAARGLASLRVSFDIVLTSPYVRARQTAEIVAAELDGRPHLVNTESLTPDGTLASVVAELGKHSKRTRIALVGHEPGLGEMAGRLIGTRHPIPFKKGAVCRIDVDTLPPSGRGELRWMLPSKVLRALRP